MPRAKAQDEAVRKLKKSSDDMQDELLVAASRAGRKVRGMIDNAEDEFTYVSERVNSEIQTRPLRAGMIVLGVGMLFGALLRR